MTSIQTLLSIFVCAITLTSCSGAVQKRPCCQDDKGKGIIDATNYFSNPGPFQTKVGKDKTGQVVEYLQARGNPGKAGGTITLSTFGSGPKTFNIWAANEVESHGVGLLMFERLVEADAWTGQIYPRLAKTIAVSSDKKQYLITLRKGLKWSDGKPITADDVVFTFNTIVAKGFGSSASARDTLSLEGKFPKVEKVDELTIRFSTHKPFSPFLNSLRNVAIAPRHILEPETKKPMNAFFSFWDTQVDPSQLVVSGPFKLARYLPERIELVRNPNYFMVDKNGDQLPYLDKFIVLVVQDQNNQVMKFYGNEVDFLDIRSVRGPDVSLMQKKSKEGQYTMYNLGPDDGTIFLTFNQNRRINPKTKKPYVDPVKQEWFNNKYFRQAVSHAINRKAIIANVLKGVGLPLYTPESTASVFFNAKLPPYPQDLQLAEDLLIKGGFKKDGTGILRDNKGNQVEFVLNTNAGNAIREATCIMIADALNKLGIKVNFQSIDWNKLVDKTNTSLDWEAIVMGLTGGKIEPYDGANVWKVDSRLHIYDQRLADKNGVVRVTDARPWEKRIDELFDLSATTFDDKLRHQYFDEYQAIVYDELPYIYLYSGVDLTAIKDNIKNYKPTPLGIYYTPMGSLHNIEEIYVDKKITGEAP